MRAERQVEFDPNGEFPITGSRFYGGRIKRLFERNKQLFQYEAWTKQQKESYPERYSYDNLTPRLKEIFVLRQDCKDEKNHNERKKKQAILKGKVDELDNAIDSMKKSYMMWAIRERYPSVEKRFKTDTIDLSHTTHLTAKRQKASYVVGNISLMLHKESSENVVEDSKLDEKIYPVLLHAIRMMRYEHLVSLSPAPAHNLVRELMILREQLIELDQGHNPMANDYASIQAIKQEKDRLSALLHIKLNELAMHVNKERDLHVVAVKRHMDENVSILYGDVDVTNAFREQSLNPSNNFLNELSGTFKNLESTNMKTDADKEIMKVFNAVLKHSKYEGVPETVKKVLILREGLSRVDGNNMLSARQKNIVRKQYRDEIKGNLNILKMVPRLVKATAPKPDKSFRGLGIFRPSKKSDAVKKETSDTRLDREDSGKKLG